MYERLSITTALLSTSVKPNVTLSLVLSLLSFSLSLSLSRAKPDV